MDADEDVVTCWGRVDGSSGKLVGGVEGGEDLSLHGGWKSHAVEGDEGW